MKNAWLLLLPAAGLLWACEPSLQVPEKARVPASDAPTIQGFLCPQDTLHRIVVRYTVPATGRSDPNAFARDLKKGVATLSGPLGAVPMQYDSIYRQFTVPQRLARLEAGGQYRFTLELPGRPPLTARCTIPARRVPPDSIRTVAAGTYAGGTPRYRLEWPALAGGGNFFAFFVLRIRTALPWGHKTVENPTSQLTLRPIGGRVRSLPFPIQKIVNSGTVYREDQLAFVCHTDSLYHAFHQALEQLGDDSPFDEPARLPTNVSNGFGVLCGYNRTELRL